MYQEQNQVSNGKKVSAKCSPADVFLRVLFLLTGIILYWLVIYCMTELVHVEPVEGYRDFLKWFVPSTIALVALWLIFVKVMCRRAYLSKSSAWLVNIFMFLTIIFVVINRLFPVFY